MAPSPSLDVKHTGSAPNSCTVSVLLSSLGVLVIPAVADNVVIEIPRYEAGVQVSSGSIPNCCSNHSMSSVNASSLSMKGCTTMGGYCMGSRNAPFLTFDLSSIPEDAMIESVRLKGSRSSPRSGGGTALVAFLPYGEVGSSMFNVFNSGSTNINWTLSSCDIPAGYSMRFFAEISEAAAFWFFS